MADVTAVRDSGVELVDTDVEDASEDAETQHFRTEEEVTVQVGETVGNPIIVRAKYFVAASIDQEADEVTQMMTGEEHINESSVFVSNEEGEIGGGFIQVDGGDVEDAIGRFEEDYL